MGIKIYTYSNPYDLLQEVFWKEIQNCPHFCVSQTMVNGFESILDPNGNYKTMTTIRNLMNTLYENWEDINTRVRQIMEIDNAVYQIEINGNNNIRSSLEYNTKSLAQCIRLFKELGIDPQLLDDSKLNPVQRCLVEIYKNISQRSNSSFCFNRMH